MAKKAQKEGDGGIKDMIKSALSSKFASTIKDNLKELIHEIIHKAQDIAYQTERKILDNLIAAVVFLFGIVMVVLAAAFFLIDRYGLERYWAFLIIGLIMLFISILFKRKIDKTKYYNFER